MAENSTRIVITAEDKTSAALQSVTRGLQGMESHALKATAALSALGVTFSAAAAVAFVKGTIDAADGMNDLSQKVGIGIRQLAGWTLAANQSGTSMESVAKGVKGLSTYLVEHGDKLRAAGITATDANGAMVQLADLFAAMPDGVEKTALAVQLFGKAGMDMIPMLNMGSQGLADAQEKAAEYGRKMAELAPMADKFNDQMAEMALQSKAAGINIAQHFIPGLIGLSKWLIDVKNNGKEAFDAIEWMFGDRAAKAAALAGLGRGGLSRESSGKIGGQPAGMTPEEEEKLGAANIARMKALGIIGPESKPVAAPKYQRAFDPEGDLDYAIQERQFQESKKRAVAAEKEMEALDEKARKMDEAHMARMEANRIESEGEEAIRLQMEKTNSALAKQKDMANSLGMTFASAFEDAMIGGKGLQSILQGLAQDVGRIFLRKTVTEPMAKAASGLFDKALGNMFGGGGDGGFDWMPSFAGGGYTGDGGRSGGLDGQGGFLAMLHPNETVTDHAAGGRASSGPPVFTFNIDARGAEMGVERRIEAAVNRAVGMAVAAVAQQADRGGNYARSLGRR